LYAINAQTIVTSVFEAALLTLLGISILTVALLRRQSDIPMDEEDEGYDEEVPTQGNTTTTGISAQMKNPSASSPRAS
jgi:hypothetical protein